MSINTPSFLEIRPKFAQIFAKLFVIEIQINYYFCLCRGAAVTIGFALAQRFVRDVLVAVMVSYFADGYNLKNAVGLANLLYGLIAVLVPAMTYISENHVSHLKVILYSTAAYIIGMVMLCFSYFHDSIPDDKIGMYFITAVLLMAVGNSGGLPILNKFLNLQLTAHEPRLDKDEDRVNARTTVWWATIFLGSILTPLIFGNATWDVILTSSTSMMGIGYLLFLCCIPLYHRSMDEATTRKISHAGPEEKKNNGSAVVAISLVKQWNWKPLSVMIPMWTTFLVFGLVIAAGDTFFTVQGSNMKPLKKENMEPTVSIYILIMIRNIISSIPSSIVGLIRSTMAIRLIPSSTLSTLRSKCIPEPLNTLGIMVIIWTAMVLSIFCCIVTWRVEVHRLHAIIMAISKGELCTDQNVRPMSIMWLAPQFCVLGLMDGIGKQGLDLFFEVQVSDMPMKRYRSVLNDAVIGIGSFLNGLLVVLLRSWFSDALNCSRLDKYYLTLTVVSLVNLCCYCYISTFYFNKKETKDDVKVEETGGGAV